MQKIAIFGGAFDPVHYGHLLLAEAALDQHPLEQILWVPTGQSPHKANQPPVDIEHRLAMVQLAIANHPSFSLSTLEAQRPGPSYAIHTLQDLQATYPQVTWYWIIGWDAFQTLPRWYRAQEIAAECHWLVVPRGGTLPTTQPEEFSGQWNWIEMPTVAISSSLVRQYCRDRRSIRYLVPDPVRHYIETHRLYNL